MNKASSLSSMTEQSKDHPALLMRLHHARQPLTCRMATIKGYSAQRGLRQAIVAALNRVRFGSPT